MSKFDSTDPDVLWVVVHGMIAMWDDSKNEKLRLLLPDVPYHAYGAGSFRDELTLEVHDYRLVVPNPGSSLDLDELQDPVLVGGDFEPPPVPQPQNARHVITLPYPDYKSNDPAVTLGLLARSYVCA